jgi:LDH2 family malate/lactate/ureidoglycolate dehydrogenase
MGAPGRVEKVAGTTPQGFAAPKNDGSCLAFDACLSYTANSVINQHLHANKPMPSHWCLDKNGNPTTNPQDVIDGGARQPIGAHKGFGLTLLGEILTGLMAEGQIIDEPQPGTGDIGKPSHTAICFDIGGLVGRDVFPDRVTEITDRMKNLADNLIVPNERATAFKKKVLTEGLVDIDDKLCDSINRCCDQFGIQKFTE